MRRRRRPFYESIIIGMVVALSLIMGASLTRARAKVEKDNLLINELSEIRTAIVAFKATVGSFPATLADLGSQTFDAGGGEKRPYLEGLPMAPEGMWIDPFGNPYVYDPASGWVKSSSPGHERW